MARQCSSCYSILYLASLSEENGVKFLTCPLCGSKTRFRKEKEDYLNNACKPKKIHFQVCSKR